MAEPPVPDNGNLVQANSQTKKVVVLPETTASVPASETVPSAGKRKKEARKTNPEPSVSKPAVTTRYTLSEILKRSALNAILQPKDKAVTINLFGITRSDLRRGFFWLLFGGAILWFLLQIQAVLPPFIIALFIAALLEPNIRRKEKRGIGRVRTILTYYAFALAMIGIFAVIALPSAKTQLEGVATNYGSYYTNIETAIDKILQNPKNQSLLKQMGVKEGSSRELFKQRSELIRDGLNHIADGVTAFLQGLASKLLWLIIIPLASFFLMRDFPVIRARCISLFPENYQPHADFLSREIIAVFADYLRGLAKICTLFGFVVAFVLWLFGVNYWLIIGIVAGLFYAVPYVGQLGTAIIIGATTYSMSAHTAFFFLKIPSNAAGFAILTVLTIVMLNNIFDQIVYPKVVGGEVGLHPVVSLFALTAAATLFGVAGMLLAVPIAASIQIALQVAFPKLTAPVHILPETPYEGSPDMAS